MAAGLDVAFRGRETASFIFPPSHQAPVAANGGGEEAGGAMQKCEL